MNSTTENPEQDKTPAPVPVAYEVTAEGSLGLLALGAAGIKAWRKKREEEKLKTNQEEKK